MSLDDESNARLQELFAAHQRGGKREMSEAFDRLRESETHDEAIVDPIGKPRDPSKLATLYPPGRELKE